MKKFLIFNWKMNGDDNYCRQIIDYMNSNQNINDNFEIILCPPIVFFNNFQDKKTNFHLGAQNSAFEISGSYTGEISPEMIKKIGGEYVILGHSERRKYFFENESMILKKMEKAIECKLTPIVCVHGFSEDRSYIADIINDFINHKSSSDLIIAYEPEFSIGSGISDTIDSIEKNINNIKNVYKNRQLNGKNIYVAYGGSVNEKNSRDILSVCDGVLIGKASMNFESFCKILEK